MLTGTQIRMARGALRWSIQELADRSGVHFATVQRAEQADGMPDMRTGKLAAIKAALESAGIEFLPENAVRARIWSAAPHPTATSR